MPGWSVDLVGFRPFAMLILGTASSGVDSAQSRGFTAYNCIDYSMVDTTNHWPLGDHDFIYGDVCPMGEFVDITSSTYVDGMLLVDSKRLQSIVCFQDHG